MRGVGDNTAPPCLITQTIAATTDISPVTGRQGYGVSSSDLVRLPDMINWKEAMEVQEKYPPGAQGYHRLETLLAEGVEVSPVGRVGAPTAEARGKRQLG